jgi:predicted nucleic acid-binding protein
VIVVDASAMVEWVLRTPSADAVETLIYARTAHAPHLLDVEIAQAIRRYTATGEIEQERGREAFLDLAGFPVGLGVAKQSDRV